MKRLFVEKKPAFRAEADALLRDLRETLGVPELAGLRVVQRYDIEGMSGDALALARNIVFAEPPVDDIHEDGALPVASGETAFAVEYLPGQFDQRADSAAQCAQILAGGERPRIASARVFVLKWANGAGDADPANAAALAKIKASLINPVDSREASLALPETLAPAAPEPQPVAVLDAFNDADPAALRDELGLAMSAADVAFCQHYFRDTEHRAPTLTEIRVLDTYWSDHCRHTTFQTRLESVEFEGGNAGGGAGGGGTGGDAAAGGDALLPVRAAWELYLETRRRLGRDDRDITLMDIATLAAKALKNDGLLDDLEESEEINAASIVVPVEIKPLAPAA
ncbi:MAG: hypothetical protein LBR07_01025 [Puniceicoccales bacterium]|jgi:phosphoribosylformylglycinamidine synthase|nr:hypothetical protein [Puniceicoccales bacterium]